MEAAFLNHDITLAIKTGKQNKKEAAWVSNTMECNSNGGPPISRFVGGRPIPMLFKPRSF